MFQIYIFMIQNIHIFQTIHIQTYFQSKCDSGFYILRQVACVSCLQWGIRFHVFPKIDREKTFFSCSMFLFHHAIAFIKKNNFILLDNNPIHRQIFMFVVYNLANGIYAIPFIG